MKDATLHSTWAPYGISYCKMSKHLTGLNRNSIARYNYEQYERCTGFLQWDTHGVFFLTMKVEDGPAPPTHSYSRRTIKL